MPTLMWPLRQRWFPQTISVPQAFDNFGCTWTSKVPRMVRYLKEESLPGIGYTGPLFWATGLSRQAEYGSFFGACCRSRYAFLLDPSWVCGDTAWKARSLESYATLAHLWATLGYCRVASWKAKNTTGHYTPK